MYRKILLDSTYIDNTDESNNFGNDPVLELRNTLDDRNVLINNVNKHITRILFKILNFDVNTRTFIENEFINNDIDLYFVSKILNNEIVEKINTKLVINKLTTGWDNGYGNNQLDSEIGVSWESNGKEDGEYVEWNGGTFDNTTNASELTINNYNDIEIYNTLKFFYNNILDSISIEDLFDYGAILKFSSSSEASPAEYFNLYLDKNKTFLLAKYNNGEYSVENDEEEININNAFYINDNINSFYIRTDNYYDSINININVNQVSTKKSYNPIESELIYILPESTSYEIIDLTTDDIIIKPDFYYNTINYIDNEMFFNICMSIFEPNHKYRLRYAVKQNNIINYVDSSKDFMIVD